MEKGMNRKDFLKTMMTSCCGAALFLNHDLQGLTNVQKKTFPETSCKNKIIFTKSWIQRFMNVLDTNLDKKTCQNIMKENGRACYLSHGNRAKKKKMSVHKFVKEMAKHVGKDNCFKKEDTIFFNYVQNPNGLKVSDGFCLCPMVEDGPKKLSSTYCYCSIGYIHEMINYYIAPPIRVELLESIHTGGKKCRFRIQMKSGD